MSEFAVCPCCGRALQVDSAGHVEKIGGTQVPRPDAQAAEVPSFLNTDSCLDLPTMGENVAPAPVNHATPDELAAHIAESHSRGMILPEGPAKRGSSELAIEALSLDLPGDPIHATHGRMGLESSSGELGVQDSIRSHSRLSGRSSTAPRTTWGTVFLAAYAGALTLLLAWLFFSGRLRGAQRATPARAGTTTAALIKSAPNLGIAEPVALARIDASRTTSLRKPLRLGALEVTPLSARFHRASLRNVIDPEQWRDESDESIWLRVRVKNLSDASTFQPVEPAFLRQPEHGSNDSLIETGEQQIGLYPLARNSEWEIIGQELPTLEPGESRELWLISAPGARANSTDKMTWRQRVRTDKNATDLIGIEFSAAEIE